MVETKDIFKYKIPAFIFLVLVVLGWYADKIIASIPVVDENLLWVISPFVFVSLTISGCLAHQESRMSDMENRIKKLERKKKKQPMQN